jgi:photosystem II stability/assembly factor-like uncharacterized protein
MSITLSNSNWSYASLGAPGAIVCSHDMKKAACISNTRVSTSTDSGLNWVSSRAGIYSGVASSADGNKLVITQHGTHIYTSVDAGDNWTERQNHKAWFAVATSDNGNVILATTADSYVYVSTDSGVNWTESSTELTGQKAFSNHDGSILWVYSNIVACESYFSTNYGVTWVKWEPVGGYPNLITMFSTHNDRLYASGQVELGGNFKVLVSDDNGATFSQCYDSDNLVYVSRSGVLFKLHPDSPYLVSFSTNSGFSWQTISSSDNYGYPSICSTYLGLDILFSSGGLTKVKIGTNSFNKNAFLGQGMDL